MEHPEQYSDEQLQELLSDEECRELYEAMRLSASAFEAEDAKEKIANGIKAEEWQKFLQRQANHSSLFTLHYSLKKLAAMFVGLLMLSGIAYAAVQMVRHTHTQEQAWNQGDRSLDSDGKAVDQGPVPLIPSDSIAQPRIFENTPLDEMVTEIAHYYNKVADIQNEQAHELRLYYKWEPQDALESIIKDLNHFDRVNLALEDDKLIVKP